jgi:hypothetical protein
MGSKLPIALPQFSTVLALCFVYFSFTPTTIAAPTAFWACYVPLLRTNDSVYLPERVASLLTTLPQQNHHSSICLPSSLVFAPLLRRTFPLVNSQATLTCPAVQILSPRQRQSPPETEPISNPPPRHGV